jgi:hypothetical protein
LGRLHPATFLATLNYPSSSPLANSTLRLCVETDNLFQVGSVDVKLERLRPSVTMTRLVRHFAPLNPEKGKLSSLPKLDGIVFDVDGTLWYINFSLVE